LRRLGKRGRPANDVRGNGKRVEVGTEAVVGAKRSQAAAVSGNPIWVHTVFGATGDARRGRFLGLPAPAACARGRSADPGGDCARSQADEAGGPALLHVVAVAATATHRVFLDRPTGIVRLRAGDVDAGWVAEFGVAAKGPSRSRPDRSHGFSVRTVRALLYILVISGMPPAEPAASAGVPGSYAAVLPRSKPKNGGRTGL